MNEPESRLVTVEVLDNIYSSLLDAYERLDNGTANIKRCLNYIENQHGYEPPAGYIKKENKFRLSIKGDDET